MNTYRKTNLILLKKYNVMSLIWLLFFDPIILPNTISNLIDFNYLK